MVVEGSVVVVVRVAKRGRFNSEMLFMKQYFPFAECYYEKEKQKLANIMTYGKDMQKWQRQEPKPKPKEPKEIDRFEECRIFFCFCSFRDMGSILEVANCLLPTHVVYCHR